MPPGAVVAFRVILAPDINVMTYLLTYLLYRAPNAVFGKIGGQSCEDVILQLIRSKCMPALLYELEACPLRLSDYNSLDLVVNRFYEIV